MSITRGFTYTVVDGHGRACYHVPESRTEIEFELAHLGKTHRLMVDVPDNDGDEVSYPVAGLLPTIPGSHLADQVVIATNHGQDSLAGAALLH